MSDLLNGGGEGVHIPIVTTADTSGAQQQAKALENLTDETARYEAKLKEMAQAEAEAGRAQEIATRKTQMLARQRQEGARAAAMAQAASQRAAAEEIANKEYAKQVDKEIAAGVINVGAADVKAAEEAAEAADKAFISKKQLRDAVKGLKKEFPELGAVARLAINPIALMTAGIAGAFVIWHKRVESLTEAFSRLRLPDLGPPVVAKVTAMAEAQAKLAEAVRNSAEHYNSVSERHKRYVESLTEELGLQKQLLEAQKAHDLATLESKKDSMSGQEYDSRRSSIEAAYANAGLKQTQGAASAVLGDKEKERDELRRSAEQKLAAAGGIHLPSQFDADKEAAVEKDHKDALDAARSTVADSRKKIDRALGILDNPVKNFFDAPGQIIDYDLGTKGSDIVKIERENIRHSQVTIDREEARERQKFAREQLRKRRDTLTQQASEEAARAEEIDKSLPEERRRLGRKQGYENATAAEEQATRKTNLAAGERGTSLGQDILRAAQLARDVGAKKRQITDLTPEEQQFLKQMDMGVTGGKTGDLKRALQTFNGVDQNPEDFANRYSRMNNVATVKQDAQTARALSQGEQVSEESKNELLAHTRLLTGVTTTLQQSVKLSEHAADTVDALNTRLSQLEQKQKDLDARVRKRS